MKGKICRYNIGVRCDDADCSRCGWYPSVEDRRLSKIRGEEPRESVQHKLVEVYDETTQRVVGKMKWPVLGAMEDMYG